MWDDHAWVVSRIRAALDAQVPPSAVLLRDPAHTEYDVWDLKMVAALQVYDELVSGGVPVYWDQNDDVFFEVKRVVSRSRAAVDRAQEQDSKSKKNTAGVMYIPVPKTMGGRPLPTLEDWLAQKAEKDKRSKSENKTR